MTVKRGDIYYADLSPVVGSEQGGIRPVLIVQNDVGNKFSPTVIAAAITSQKDKTKLPTHISVSSQNCGLAKDSIVLLEQIRTIDKQRLGEKMGHLDAETMNAVDDAITISLGLGTNRQEQNTEAERDCRIKDEMSEMQQPLFHASRKTMQRVMNSNFIRNIDLHDRYSLM